MFDYSRSLEECYVLSEATLPYPFRLWEWRGVEHTRLAMHDESFARLQRGDTVAMQLQPLLSPNPTPASGLRQGINARAFCRKRKISGLSRGLSTTEVRTYFCPSLNDSTLRVSR